MTPLPSPRPAIRNGTAKLLRAIGATLLGLAPHSGAQGFHYLSTGSPAPAHVISPDPASGVELAWIDTRQRNSVQWVHIGKDLRKASPAGELYRTLAPLRAVNLERSPDGDRFLATSQGSGSQFVGRITRFDPTHQPLGQVQWTSSTPSLSAGRMLDPRGRLVVGTRSSSAIGHSYTTAPLAHDGTFAIEAYVPAYSEGYNGSWYRDGVALSVTGLDTACASDGRVTAVFELVGVTLKRYTPDLRVEQELFLAPPPVTPFYESAQTAVDVLPDTTTLVGWEWHALGFVGTLPVTKPSTPAVRALHPDGTLGDTLLLQPSSEFPELTDRPAVGLRADGSGAVAWTARSAEGSTVWLQRLDTHLEAFEAPRLVDARPGFDTDQPVMRGDGKGGLYLSWRCTSRGEEPAQIGILDLNQLDRALRPPAIARRGGTVSLDWQVPPATSVRLWHSPDLDRAHAVELCHDTALGGTRSFEHAPGASQGFYWLTSD